MQWLTRHIKGHQDEVEGAELDRWALLNVECDLRAKTYLTQIIDGYKRSAHTIPKGMWQIKLCGMPVGTNLISYLRKVEQECLTIG